MLTKADLGKILGGDFGLGSILFERSHKGHFVLLGLEATVTHLGAGVDELELDLFKSLPLGVHQQGLTKGQHTLLRSNATTLDHDKVLLDQSVMGEPTHGVDRLISQIIIGSSIVLHKLAILHVESITDVINLLVDLGSVMVTLLTGASDGELDSAGMPGTNTSDLAKTFMGLPWQLLGMPTGGHTLESFSLGDTNDVDHFVFGKDLLDGDLLFEVLTGKVDLIGDGSTVQLDFHNMSLLLTAFQKSLLGVTDHTDNLAILLDLRQVLFDLLFAHIVFPLKAGFSKGLLFRFAPVLVEATLALDIDVFGPNGLKGTKTTRSLDVANHADGDQWWGLEDGDGLDDFTSSALGSGTFDFTDNVSHTGFEAQKGRKMDGLLGVILGEGLDLTAVAAGALLGVESHRAMTRRRKLTVRHEEESS